MRDDDERRGCYIRYIYVFARITIRCRVGEMWALRARYSCGEAEGTLLFMMVVG